MRDPQRRKTTDYLTGTVMEPEVISTLKPSFTEYENLGKEQKRVIQRIQSLQEDMKRSRVTGAFQELQRQMREIKELVKVKEDLDSKMAVMDLARKQDDDHRMNIGLETSYAERIQEVGERIRQFEEMVASFSESGGSLDFARCQRPDGSFYGTRGKCRKGTEAGPAEPKPKGRKANKGESVAPIAPVPPRPLEDVSKMLARLDKRREELRKFKQEENKRLAEMIRAGKVKGVTAADLDRVIARKKKEAAEKAGVEETPPARARKPKRSEQELYKASQELNDRWNAARKAAKEAERAFKAIEKETKGDKSPEARRKRIQAGKAWDKATAAADRIQKDLMRVGDMAARARRARERRQMSPEQRRQEEALDKEMKLRG